jgi:hypothetical protein
MMKHARPGVVLIATMIAGCVNPYPEPVIRISESEAVKEGDVRVAKPEWRQKYGTGLNAPRNVQDLRLNASLYKDFYMSHYRQIVSAMNTGDGATLLGGLLGVAGAISGSKAMLYQGGGLAGGSAIYTDHYQLKIQAENYLRASDTMRCVERAIAEIPDRVEFTSAGLRVATMALDDVTNKLEKAQRNIVLAEPDFNRLQKALTQVAPPFNALALVNDPTVTDKSFLPAIEECVSKF